jgi:3-oxoacyl-[acyl-carrier protein] reductase
MELEGRVAIVTGSARNIGRAIVLELAAAGAAVVVNARSDRPGAEQVAAEITAKGGRALAHLADVADEAAVRGMVETGVERFGRVDILDNNAAVRREAAIDDIDLKAWREILGIILDGAFLCAKACLPHLRRSDRGAIVNIGGLTGHVGAKGRAHVVTAKAGLIGLTRALAHDLAADGITVNCIVPGLIATERAVEPTHHSIAKTPLGRRGEPQEIAAAVRYLCSARYVTGQTLHANGGLYMG